MKRTLLFLTVAAMFTACGGSGETTENNGDADTTGTESHEGHDHEGHEGHDHGDATEAQVKMLGEYMSFGAEITPDDAISVDEMVAMMEESEEVNIKLTAPIIEACQKKGCWMTLDLGNEDDIMVRFLDYAFFVPKDAGGKTAIVEGRVFKTEITVEELQHYAQDAGKSQEEIDAITESEHTLAIEANGVLIK